MRLNMRKTFLTALILFGALGAWAEGWKFAGTTVYGTGGYWQNGQKTRIDCSYKNGVFQYERKVTMDKDMAIYSAKAIFSEPKQVYVPGEDIGVRVEFSQTGESSGYAPYARVTVMPQNPKWSKGSGASNRIPASGAVDGQAVDAAGRNTATPPETVTLMAQVPTSGEQMAIVYSCNGMDVVYLYKWDGKVTATPAAPIENPVEETTDFTTIKDDDQEVENMETQIEAESMPEEEMPQEADDEMDEEDESDLSEELDDYEDSPAPILKYVIVIGVALLLIGLILFVFRKKKNKEPVEEPVEDDFQQQEQPVMQQPAHVCPNCGAPIGDNERFCGNCGQKLN